MEHVQDFAHASFDILGIFLLFLIPVQTGNFLVTDAVFLVVAVIAALLLFPRRAEPPLRRRLRILFFLPGFWFLSIGWSALFRPATPCMTDWSSPYFVPPHPHGVYYTLYLALSFAVLFSIYCIKSLKGARVFVSWISLVNGYGFGMLSFACLAYLGGGLCGL